MKRIMTIMAMLSLVFGSFAATKTKTLVSPNGKIKVEITIGNRLTLSVFQGDEQILKDCPPSLQLGKE
ncbi:MAG: glycoside hydrolase family 97 protein, partial [Prevotella sp.]|nr:glycoside hydrolase family 97 protein [Prevotella sp.]